MISFGEQAGSIFEDARLASRDGPGGSRRYEDLSLSTVLRRRRLRIGFASLTRPVSFWLAAGLIVFVIAQSFELTGPTLDATGAQVAGWLAQLLLVSLLVEAATRRIPLILVIIPVLFYGGYYVEFLQQGEHANAQAAQLARSNPARLLAFDPNIYDLALDNAEAFVATHRLPVAYAPARAPGPPGYVAYRLSPAEQAGELSYLGQDFQVLKVTNGDAPLTTVRVIRDVEVPKKTLILVTSREPAFRGWEDWNVGESTIRFEVEGRRLGEFRTAYVMRLPRFPALQMGCETDSAGRRSCGVKFLSYRQDLDTRPAGVDSQRFDDPVSMALTIALRTNKELTFPERISGKRQNPNDPGFAILSRILAGRTEPTTWNTASQIAAEPDRLAPILDRLVDRLESLGQRSGDYAPYAAENRNFVAYAITSARTQDLQRLADRIGPIVRAGDAWKNLPGLYVRAADLSPKLYSFYRDRLLGAGIDPGEQMLAALALCRMGLADGELIAKLRTLALKPPEGEDDDPILRSAAFVALKKVGQDSFLRSVKTDERGAAGQWFAAVLAQVGETSVGPNNCMALEWPYAAPLPKILTPSLSWDGADWRVSPL